MLYLASAAVTLSTVALPPAPGFNARGVTGVALVAGLIGVVAMLVPWNRWRVRTSFWLLMPPAVVLIGIHNTFGGDDPYRYGLFFLVAFAWCGLFQKRGTPLVLAPLVLVAYLVPLMVQSRPGWAMASAAYAIPMYVLVGETIAWQRDRLHGLESKLRHDATHDSLTGLATRAVLHERVTATNAASVLFLDLDDFKIVNDSLGHAAGDQLLIAASQRLVASLREGDLAARLGGDEFGVLLPDADVETACTVAQRVLDRMAMPYRIGTHVMRTGVSIGVVQKGHESDAGSVLRDADVAMYTAKAEGKHRYAVYDPRQGAIAVARMSGRNDVRRALERNELVLHFQPVIELESGCMAAVEALVRWRHPERGLLLPAELLPLVDEAGLGPELDRWVLEHAVRMVRRWQLAYPDAPPVAVAVNVPPGRVNRDLVRAVQQVLRETAVDPGYLVIEVTEEHAAEHDGVVLALAHLRAIGVSVALDDFGRGYSSLAYLERLPADFVKLDKMFTIGLATGPRRTALSGGLIRLAHDLGFRVVAEGVEQADQLAALHALGCDFAQGWHLGRPVEATEIDAMLGRSQAQGAARQRAELPIPQR